MKKIIIPTLVLLLLITPFLISVLYAQPVPTNTESPIDGGVSILLGMGVLYGIRKIYKSGKKHKLTEQD